MSLFGLIFQSKQLPLPPTFPLIIGLQFCSCNSWFWILCKDSTFLWMSSDFCKTFGNLAEIRLAIWRVFVWQFGENLLIYRFVLLSGWKSKSNQLGAEHKRSPEEATPYTILPAMAKRYLTVRQCRKKFCVKYWIFCTMRAKFAYLCKQKNTKNKVELWNIRIAARQCKKQQNKTN